MPNTLERSRKSISNNRQIVYSWSTATLVTLALRHIHYTHKRVKRFERVYCIQQGKKLNAVKIRVEAIIVHNELTHALTRIQTICIKFACYLHADGGKVIHLYTNYTKKNENKRFIGRAANTKFIGNFFSYSFDVVMRNLKLLAIAAIDRHLSTNGTTECYLAWQNWQQTINTHTHKKPEIPFSSTAINWTLHNSHFIYVAYHFFSSVSMVYDYRIWYSRWDANELKTVFFVIDK